MVNKRIIFHIDVNSAYLSWEAVERLQHGALLDLREVPSIVGGNPETRHGIVLAKSIPAKKYDIQTGETLYSALQKCPDLVIAPPNYTIYMRCSNSLMGMLEEYSPLIQRYSIDECFLDFTGMENVFKDYIMTANDIKNRIKKELGFTVNIGISSNKLLAKMASDFKKPDLVHTLFPEEVPDKMWPLPIEDLFMCGRATASKLHKMNIHTIGDLAKTDLEVLEYRFKSFANTLWQYANGIDYSEVNPNVRQESMKGLGNSTTIAFDVTDRRTAHMVLMSLAETVGMRLRNERCLCQLVAISIRNKDLESYSHQRKLNYATDSTNEIICEAESLFNEAWQGEPIRHLGLRVSNLCSNEFRQVSLFNLTCIEKDIRLNRAVDDIRMKYGDCSLIRSAFVHSGIRPLNGGVGAEDYPVMSSIL